MTDEISKDVKVTTSRIDLKSTDPDKFIGDLCSIYDLLAKLEAKGPIAVVAHDAIIEASNAAQNWPEYNSAHEALGLLREEVHEFELEVYKRQGERDSDAMYREAIQVAAVAMRTAAAIKRDPRWIRN